MMLCFIDYVSDVPPLPRDKFSVRCGDVNDEVSQGSGTVVHRGEAPDVQVNVTVPPEAMTSTGFGLDASLAAVLEVSDIVVQRC